MESFLFPPWSWSLQDYIRFHFAVILIQFSKISFYERRIIRGAEFVDDIPSFSFSTPLKVVWCVGLASLSIAKPAVEI